MEGSVTFQLNIAPADVKGCAANLNSELVDMESIPEAYRDFSDIFSKAKADTLAPHRPYNLKIALEDSATPPQPVRYHISYVDIYEYIYLLYFPLYNSFI